VLDTADRLQNEENLRFILAGAGAERSALMAEARNRRLDNVIFVPPQPKDNMPAIWSLCDVALVHLRNNAAFREVIPSKIFEAMAMGLPIILATPEGEASRIVAENGAGIWVPAEDPDALAQAVRRLMYDSETRRTLAAQSLAAAPEYTRENQARKMLAVLELAAAGRGSEVGVLVPT
jgi:glycosyltransferase involved in cell wall biosynthesis